MKAHATVIFICFFLVSCETTGDPTKGGLFGWDEQKAIERQQLLRRKSTDIQRERDMVAAQNRDLAAQNVQLKNEEASLNKELQDLIKERLKLTRQLGELRRTHADQSERVKQLMLTYQLNQNDISHMNTTFSAAGDIGRKKDFVSSVAEQNKVLLDEILLLLGN